MIICFGPWLRNGGVIQMNFLSAYVKKKDLGPATVSDVVDHIDHIVKIAGIDHVGIGTILMVAEES